MACEFWNYLVTIGFVGNKCPFEIGCDASSWHIENINPLIDCQAAITENLLNSTAEVEPSPEELIANFKRKNGLD